MAEDKRQDNPATQPAHDVQEDTTAAGAQFIEAAAAQLWNRLPLSEYEKLTNTEDNLEDTFYAVVEQAAQDEHEHTVKVTIDGKEIPTPKDIYINVTPDDPRLCPGNPEFDMEAYRAAVDAAGGPEAVIEKMNDLTRDVVARLQDSAIDTLHDLAMKTAQIMRNSDAYKALNLALARIMAKIEEPAVIELFGESIADILPHMAFERQESSDKEIRTSTLIEILQKGLNKNLTAKKNKYGDVIRAARQQKKKGTRDMAAAGEEQFLADLPKLQSVIPQKHIMPNNTLMNDLAGQMGHQPINAGAYDLPVIPASKRQKEVNTYVMVTYEPEKDVTSSLSEYERSVSDAIFSIIHQAFDEDKPALLTEDSVYRAMPGRGESASNQQKEAIGATIEKFIHLYLEVDATEELRKKGVIGEGETYHVKDYYLRAQEHEYIARGGQKSRGWVVKKGDVPLPLAYATLTGQYITVQAKHLAIEKVKNGKASGEILTMTPQRQAMASYMMRRIAVMQHDLKKAKEALRSYNRRAAKDPAMEKKTLDDFRDQSDIILFDTLFKVTGTETQDRKQMMLNRKFCFSVLDYWKVSGNIKGYTIQNKGKSITGVEIVH